MCEPFARSMCIALCGANTDARFFPDSRNTKHALFAFTREINACNELIACEDWHCVVAVATLRRRNEGFESVVEVEEIECACAIADEWIKRREQSRG